MSGIFPRDVEREEGLGKEDPDPVGSQLCFQFFLWDWERRIPVFWDLGFFPRDLGKEDPSPVGC